MKEERKMYDTHMHTKPFSTDSEMKLDEVLNKTKETGLKVVLIFRLPMYINLMQLLIFKLMDHIGIINFCSV